MSVSCSASARHRRAREEVVGEQRDVFAPLAQRGDAQRRRAQELVQVLPERAAPHELFGIGGRRGDRAQVEAHARVGGVGIAQRRGETHLERRRQTVDRVEKERAAVRVAQRGTGRDASAGEQDAARARGRTRARSRP